MRRFHAAVAAVALGAALVAVASVAPANAKTGRSPAAAAAQNCWIAIDTGESLCVDAGQDLVAAVAAERGVRLVLPNDTEIGGRQDLAALPGITATSVALSTIYDDAGYGGGSYTMSVSNGSCAAAAYGFTDLGPIGWDGRVSAYRSYAGCKTAVFSSTGYGGSSSGYAVNASSLGSMNDRAQSWRVSG